MSLSKINHLEGKISYLVPFGEKHLTDPAYLAWLHDYEVVKTINRPEYLKPISFEEVKKYCERVMSSSSDIFLAIHLKPGAEFVGTLKVHGIDFPNRVADIGILIGRTFWGRGIATDAVQTICRYLFDVAGMRKLTAGMMANNPAMVRIFEKLGFRTEGVMRQQDLLEEQYIDHIHMGCFKEEFVKL